MQHKEVAEVLFETLQVIRAELDPEMQLQTLLTLLIVDMEPGITMTEALKKIGISQAAMSRNAAILGRLYSKGEPGLDMIAATEDPMERRRKVMRMTPKGEKLLAELAARFTHVVARVERRKST
jgi:DNA-binding MarR family transcriptional regulator